VVKSINLSDSGLVGTIDPLFGELGTLEEVQLQNNELQGTIPDEMNHMESLSTFIVDNNPDLSGSPDFLCDVEVFSFVNTKIPQDLCSSYLNLKKVLIGLGVSEAELVDESHCNWYGVTCHSGTTDAQKISFSKSSLVGTIDPSVGKLKTLETLHVNQNSIYGTIPSTVGNMISLKELRFWSNSLTGTIPTQM